MSDTGEGPTTEGPADKVCTPQGRELSPRRRPCPTLGRGRQPRGHWTRYVHPGEGTQPQEEAVSDTGEGLTTEGPGDKVCTPGEGRRGRGTRYVHPGKGGYLAQEEAISDTGEGLTTEGPGDKVCTPGEGRRGRGTRYVHPAWGKEESGEKAHKPVEGREPRNMVVNINRKYNGIKEIYYEVFLS